MEYVDGETLRAAAERARARLEPAEAARIDEGILDALAYSHRMGIVHRDIKPANVMITRAARRQGDGLRHRPRHRRHRRHDDADPGGHRAPRSTSRPSRPRASRSTRGPTSTRPGACCSSCSTGRPPFVGDSPVAIAYQHVGEQPQPPSSFNHAVGRGLDAVTLHALAKDREAPLPERDRLPGRPRGRPARPIRSAPPRWAPRPPSARSPRRPSRSRMPSPAPRRRCSARHRRSERYAEHRGPACRRPRRGRTTTTEAAAGAGPRSSPCSCSPCWPSSAGRAVTCVRQPDAGRDAWSPCRRSRG